MRQPPRGHADRVLPRVLLISPPWQVPLAPSLALATLRPLLLADGLACDELHGSLLYSAASVDLALLESASGFVFASLLRPDRDRDRLRERILTSYRAAANIGGILVPESEATFERLGIDEGALRDAIAYAFDQAVACLDRCVAHATARDYEIIALSVTFEHQIPAAVALATRLKALRPGVKVVLGGAACAQEQGLGLLASFSILDAVCCTEGERVIVPLVRALQGEGELGAVPGIAYRADDGAVVRTPSPPLVDQLDELPVPDFGPFLEQFERSEWRHVGRPYLMFETSRGCWWGQKHLCTFCGLNAEGLAFRRKSVARVLDEIRALYDLPGTSGYLQATDNILDMRLVRELMPKLAELPQDPRRPLRLFFEVKSNLRRDQVHALARAGIVSVQPGIESFSDEVLALMKKGATGAGQVQFLKWADEANIKPVYNIILRSPGEEASWYREMERLIPFIDHLPPPTGLTPMLLERFSPYHTERSAYGFTDVKPEDHYADLFHGFEVDLDRVAYLFDFRHPILGDEDLLAAHRAFAQRVVAWQKRWEPDRLWYVDHGDLVSVHDRRGSPAGEVTILTGLAAELFRYLDSARRPEGLARRFRGVDPALLRCQLELWKRRRWVCAVGGRLLAVCPARSPQSDAAPSSRRPDAPSAASTSAGSAGLNTSTSPSLVGR